jgi:hypothetical protein
MSGLAVGFNPPHPAPERVKTRGWARDDVLPGINAGVSSATRHILPTPMDRRRRTGVNQTKPPETRLGAGRSSSTEDGRRQRTAASPMATTVR